MFEVFDPFFEGIAWLLSVFYSLPVVGNSYGLAIILLTITVMTVVMPLTLKATKSTIAMQQLQPELKALQKKYKDDRTMLNQETMAMYKKHSINPVGGCLPMLAQLPVFLILYRIFVGLTTKNNEAPFFGIAEAARVDAGGTALDGEVFNPQYLPQDSLMYEDLTNVTSMPFGPFDLSVKTIDIIQENIFQAIPYLLLMVFVVAGSYYQQRQVSARRGSSAAAANPMQQQLLRVMPLMSGVWGFIFPSALLLYWATSSLFRIGQQGIITRSFYRGENAPGIVAAEVIESSKNDDSSDDTDSSKPGKKVKVASAAQNGNGKKKSGSKKSTSGPAKKNGSSKKSTTNDRNAAWAERRAKKAKQKNRSSNSHSNSSRITPKGTKPSGPKKKRKR